MTDDASTAWAAAAEVVCSRPGFEATVAAAAPRAAHAAVSVRLSLTAAGDSAGFGFELTSSEARIFAGELLKQAYLAEQSSAVRPGDQPPSV